MQIELNDLAIMLLAKEIAHDQHGPSFWKSLTDQGRIHYVDRTKDVIRRANLRMLEENQRIEESIIRGN